VSRYSTENTGVDVLEMPYEVWCAAEAVREVRVGFLGLTRSVADTVMVTERQAIPKLFLMIRMARFWTFQIVFSRATESQSDRVALQIGLTLYEQAIVNDPIQPDRPRSADKLGVGVCRAIGVRRAIWH
jgi:hypothetical protein